MTIRKAPTPADLVYFAFNGLCMWCGAPAEGTYCTRSCSVSAQNHKRARRARRQRKLERNLGGVR